MTVIPVRIERVKVEHYHSPLGIQTPSPRLSWSFAPGPENWKQAAYELEIQRSQGDAECYTVESDRSILVEWPSAPLRSRERAEVRVRVQGADRMWSEWASLSIETALLDRADWSAVPVTCPPQATDKAKQPFRVRHRFDPSSTERARLYITALGLYEVYLNGTKISDDLLAPGWTSYYARLNYQVYDVTHLLVPGENILGAWVGEGWYAGRLGYQGGTANIYGDRLALIAQLEIDGKVQAATGQGEWEWSYGAIITSELYNGEVYDTTVSDDDWGSSGWSPVETLPLPDIELVRPQAPPVQVVKTLKVQEIITTPSGKTILDFGQNFAGTVRLASEPPAGSKDLVIRHAEVLEHGELGTRPLRYAKATDTITLGGAPVKGYMPKFTFHGFRYVEVTGWEGIGPADIEGVVFQTAMERIGDFECSHKLINRLHENCVWSTISNTISVPTDCPQRDERLGWTGDICVFAPTMSYLFDTAGFLGGWLKDLWEDQKRLNGIVPIFVPDTQTDHSFAEAIWGDVSVLTPHDLHVAYGDTKVLSDQYASLKMWLEKGVLRDKLTGLWSREQDQLGDWLAPKAPPETPNMGPTDNFLVADAWLIHATRTAAKIARLIDLGCDADKFTRQADQLVDAFYAEYVTASGRVISDTQTAICLILRFDIFPRSADTDTATYRARLTSRLVELVKRANWQIDTGFAGTPIILQTLADIGHVDHAYRMLQAKNCPSWLATVLLGGTTIWERWDSMLADGTINPGEMTSFNHYALGSVASFMHEYIGGLSPAAPGWKEILIKPQPGGTVSSAKTSHRTPYGEVSVEWKIDNGEMRVKTVVPPNTTAKVLLPGLKEEIGSGSRTFTVRCDQPAFPPQVYVPHFAPIRPDEWVT